MSGGFLEVDDNAWRLTLELNLLTAVRTTRAALPALLGGGGGVVDVASEAAHLPDPPIVDYAAAKAALRSLSKALATEFGRNGVRSNVVSPGPTRTTLWDAARCARSSPTMTSWDPLCHQMRPPVPAAARSSSPIQLAQPARHLPVPSAPPAC